MDKNCTNNGEIMDLLVFPTQTVKSQAIAWLFTV
jgi:hypothetical protein